MDTKELGRFGEKLAAQLLEKHGYQIVERNWRFGREGEIDIIAQDPNGEHTAFIEVKTRSTRGAGGPFAAITARKYRKMRHLALRYCATNPHRIPRLDVIGVDTSGSGQPRVRHLKGVLP